MPMEGTYLAWVKIQDCGDVDAYTKKLEDEAKVWMNPGTMYGEESGKGYIRINLACPRATLLEALERIKNIQK